MVKSIAWIVVVALLLAWGIMNPIPAIFDRFPPVGIYILIPYVWLLVLAIISLVRSTRKSPT